MKNTQVITFMGLLVSMEIMLTRFFAIQTPIVRIGFGFIPIAVSAMLFGPVIGGITAMIADIAGMMIFPKGVYFPGFTFSALLTGVIFGLFLYRREKTIIRIAAAVLIITLAVDIVLNTVWLSMITGKGALAILPPRLLKSLLMLPVQVFSIHMVWRYAGRFIESKYLLKNTGS